MKTQINFVIQNKFITLEIDLDESQTREWLTQSWGIHIQSRLIRRLKKQAGELGQMVLEETQNFKLDDLCAAPPDEIETEAIKLASLEIVRKLAKDGLPPPRNLRDHAMAAVNSNSSYYERARQHLQARIDVVHETLGNSYADNA